MSLPPVLTDVNSPWVQAIGFFVVLLIAGILTPLIRHWAIDLGMYDIPNDRKIHTYPIPRLGGVAIWGGYVLGLGLLACFYHEQLQQDPSLLGIIIGGSIIFFVGLLDDLYNLNPFLKLFGQCLAAVTAFALGVQVTALDLPFSQILQLWWLSFPITMLWIIGISNALNFIDGVDGLAGGVSMISALTMAVVAFTMHEPIPALLAILLAGAALGFLNFNFYPARIFMGDSGALFCGFTLACIAVTGVLKTLTMTMLVPVVILTVPIVDITYSTLRRLWRFQSPFVADADHLHHKLLKAGLSQMKVVVTLYSVCIIAGIAASWYIGHLAEYFTALGSVVAITVITVTLTRLMGKKESPRVDLTQQTPGPNSST